LFKLAVPTSVAVPRLVAVHRSKAGTAPAVSKAENLQVGDAALQRRRRSDVQVIAEFKIHRIRRHVQPSGVVGTAQRAGIASGSVSIEQVAG